MKAETKTKISVSLVTAFAVAALWSVVIWRNQVENLAATQNTYNICSLQGVACPDVQMIWANLR